MIDMTNIPKHVAIIMDGNRRWAKGKGLNVVAGHAYVVEKSLEPIIEHAGNMGIKYLTLWAFSTENWKRDTNEVNGIMEIFKKGIQQKLGKLIAKGARIRFIGDLTKFSSELQDGMQLAVEKSKNNEGINVTFALNYGGRDEIKRAVKQMIEDYKSSNHSLTQGSELESQDFEKYLDTAGIPDPDLIIRTGGEQRMSGFLMWSAQYSEFYFTDILMPDLTPEKFDEAIAEYQSRARRFGG